MDDTLKELTLGVTWILPVSKYNPLHIPVSVTVSRLGDETDEDFFARAHSKLNKVLEAEVALQVNKVRTLEMDGGVLNFAYQLADDIAVGNNSLVEAALEVIKQN